MNSLKQCILMTSAAFKAPETTIVYFSPTTDAKSTFASISKKYKIVLRTIFMLKCLRIWIMSSSKHSSRRKVAPYLLEKTHYTEHFK